MHDIFATKKKSNASFIQVILSHFHENFTTEKIKKDSAKITINKSVKVLLIIIKNGMSDQINIKNLSKIGLVFNKKK